MQVRPIVVYISITLSGSDFGGICACKVFKMGYQCSHSVQITHSMVAWTISYPVFSPQDFFFLHCFGLCLSFKTNYLSVPLPWWQKTRLKESEQLGHAGHLAMSVSQRSGICSLSEPRLKHYAWRQHARMRDVAFMTNSAWLGKDRIAAHLGVDFEKLATTPHSQVDGLIWGRLM